MPDIKLYSEDVPYDLSEHIINGSAMTEPRQDMTQDKIHDKSLWSEKGIRFTV